jgi:hypothetical protein
MKNHLNSPVDGEIVLGEQLEAEMMELAAVRARIAALKERGHAPSLYEGLTAGGNVESEEIHVALMGEEEEPIKRITMTSEGDGHDAEQGGGDHENWRPTERALRALTGRERQNRRYSEHLLARVEGFCKAAENREGGPVSGGADLGRFFATCGEAELEHHRLSLVSAHASIGRAISLIVATQTFRSPGVPAAEAASA